MENGHIVYEGCIYGVGEWSFSKVNKLLKNAFENVSYKHMDESGAIFVSGISPMFEENEENRSSVFDLLVDSVDEGGKGLVIGKKWDSKGTLEMTAYDFTNTGWTSRDVTL